MKLSTLITVSLSLVFFSACTMGSSNNATPPPSPTSGSNSSWVWDGAQLEGKHTVILKTSKGDITVELDADIAPKTVTNFMALASSGFYDGLTFHRVIPGFMIQGGDPNGNGTGGASIYGSTFEDEINASSATYKRGYKKGVMAMANSGPNTNGSQFFIMDADYPLSPDYTIFGNVTEGQDIVKAIATVPVVSTEQGHPQANRPVEAVTFTVTVVK